MVLRAEFDVSTHHVFPRGVLAAIFLLGNGAGDGEICLETNCEPKLSLCFLVGMNKSQVTAAEAPSVKFLVKYVIPLQVLQPLSQEKYWGNRACVGTPIVSGCRLCQSSLGQRFGLFLICCLCKYQAWLPPPCSDATLGLSLSWFFQLDSPLKPLDYSWSTVDHAACQVWSVWGLSVSERSLWRSGHRQKLGCFWWVACVSASNGCPSSAETPLWDLVLSGSYGSIPKQVWSIWLTKVDACPGVVTGNSTGTHAGFNSLPPPAFGARSQSSMCS